MVKNKNKTFSRYPTFASGLVSQFIYQWRKNLSLFFNIWYANLGTGILLPSLTIPCVKTHQFSVRLTRVSGHLLLEFCSEHHMTQNERMLLIFPCKYFHINIVKIHKTVSMKYNLSVDSFSSSVLITSHILQDARFRHKGICDNKTVIKTAVFWNSISCRCVGKQ